MATLVFLSSRGVRTNFLHNWPNPPRPCRPNPLTVRLSTLRVVYALFHEATFKILSNFANPEIVTSISANIRKGFTGQKSKIANVFNGPYGFTGKIPPTPPPHHSCSCS